jgi:hypothetical protein
MNIANPSKALIALVGLICITVLMVTDSISQDAGIGLLSAVIGYSIGNGIAAKQGVSVQPIIGRKSNTSQD